MTKENKLSSTHHKLRSQFELLLPVGQKEMVLAAIHNGADAIFLGFPEFNARGRSYDFSLNELKEIIDLCHLYNVKVNLALNIVIFENEIEELVEALRKVLVLKPDSLIVQDIGLITLIRELAPDQPIHASTQMTVTNDLAIQLLKDLKIKRFVLGRENSLKEIRAIKQNTTEELEVFVHGALCVSYSGQCFTSETLGGRSANRGQCAQSCRFEYDLIVDGEKKNQVGRQYLVSPQDLCGIQEIPELMDIGVVSFKVEGRLKTPEYVASVSSSFNHVIHKTLQKQQVDEPTYESLKAKMALQYSRGFFSGWLHGVNHQKLVNGTYNSHRGLLIGEIYSVERQNYIIAKINKNYLNSIKLDLKQGDGLSWQVDKEFKGSFIYSVEQIKTPKGEVQDIQFSYYRLGLDKNASPKTGSRLFYNHDKELKKELENSYTHKNNFKKLPLSLTVNFKLNEPLIVKVMHDVFSLEYKTTVNAELAQKSQITRERIEDELSALSATPFILSDFDIEMDEQLFIPMAEVKKIRQQMTEDLTYLRTEYFHFVRFQQNVTNDQAQKLLKTPYQVSLKSITHKTENKQQELVKADDEADQFKIHLLLRSKEQVISIVKSLQTNESQLNLFIQNVKFISLDFEFGLDYEPSIQMLSFLREKAVQIGVATTRILKPLEYQNLKILKNLNPDFILVRNLGALYYYAQVNIFAGELKADFSLNVSNSLSFNYLINKGLNSICLSYDANHLQISSLLNHLDHDKAKQAEVTIHQTMPSFHMEHCVFAAFLSKGSSFKDCGKPCEKHKVELKDQFGHHHWIKPDQECRNTMFNATAQTALPFVEGWRKNGLQQFRIEALKESGSEILNKLEIYISFLNHKTSLHQALQDLNVQESYGLSTGALSRDIEYESRKKNHSFMRE